MKTSTARLDLPYLILPQKQYVFILWNNGEWRVRVAYITVYTCGPSYHLFVQSLPATFLETGLSFKGSLPLKPMVY